MSLSSQEANSSAPTPKSTAPTHPTGASPKGPIVLLRIFLLFVGVPAALLVLLKVLLR